MKKSNNNTCDVKHFTNIPNSKTNKHINNCGLFTGNYECYTCWITYNVDKCICLKKMLMNKII